MPRCGRYLGRVLSCILACAVLPGIMQAQSTTQGAIGGVIVDSAGVAVGYAEVTARNSDTGATRVTQTDEEGNYRFPALAPGLYAVSIVKPTFGPLDVAAVLVEVGRLTPLPAHLAAAGAQETVVVREEVPRLELDSPALATNVGETAIQQLPINERRWSDFALLTPTVTSDEAGTGLLSFRGVSTLLNNNTIDGANNNQAFFSEERGRTRVAYSTTQASVREFQVNASNYSAEFGRAAGGVVNTVTRSGTNELHGKAFLFDRDQAWGAQNPFTQMVAQPSPGVFTSVPVTPTDRRQQWGAGLGGPLRRDKLFWFFAYDQYRRDFPAIARVGNVDSFFNKPLTSAELEDLRQRLGLALPGQAKIAYENALTALAGETGLVPRSANQLILFPRLDWQPSDRNHFSIQVNRMRWNSPGGVHTGPSTTYGISSFGTHLVKNDWVIARWNRFVRSSLVNEVQYQYGRDFESEWSQPPSPYEQPLSNNVYGRSPEISLMGSNTGIHLGKPSTLDRSALPDERRNEFADKLTWVHGSHTLKAGYEYNHVNDKIGFIPNGNGTYVYDSLLNYVSDLLSPSHCGAGGGAVGFFPCYSYFTQSLGPDTFDFGTNDYAAYLSGTWKLHHGLTVTYGVRYDYQQIPHTNTLLANPDLPQTTQAPQDGNNFGPRLGVAWDIFGHGKTVVRAGYGLYYGRISNATIFSALTNTGSPNGQLSYYFKPVDAGAPPFPHVFAGQVVVPVAPAVAYFDRRFQNPQVHEMEASLGQQLPGGVDLTVSFLASLGRELPNFLDTNIDLASIGSITYKVKDPASQGPLSSPTYTTTFFTQRLNPKYQQITDILSETNSQYSATVLKLTRRLHRNIHLQASYTYAHAMDFNQNESTFARRDTFLDPTNLRQEYGPSNFDVRQRVTGGGVLRTPWRAHGFAGVLVNGYSAAPVASLQTGLPFSMHTAGSVPSVRFVDQLNRTQVLSGLGNSINGSGGANRIAEIGRNTFRYPGHINVDLRLAKETALSEHMRLEFFAEAFNLLNHQNVTQKSTVGYYINGASSATNLPTLTYDSSFGIVTNANNTTLYRERQIQIAAQLHF